MLALDFSPWNENQEDTWDAALIDKELAMAENLGAHVSCPRAYTWHHLSCLALFSSPSNLHLAATSFAGMTTMRVFLHDLMWEEAERVSGGAANHTPRFHAGGGRREKCFCLNLAQLLSPGRARLRARPASDGRSALRNVLPH